MTGELRAICTFFRPVKVFAGNKIMACSHRGGEPQADWAPHLVEITRLVVHGHINSFILGCFHMRSGVPRPSGLHGQPGRVTRLGGVNFPHMNA